MQRVERGTGPQPLTDLSCESHWNDVPLSTFSSTILMSTSRLWTSIVIRVTSFLRSPAAGVHVRWGGGGGGLGRMDGPVGGGYWRTPCRGEGGERAEAGLEWSASADTPAPPRAHDRRDTQAPTQIGRMSTRTSSGGTSSTTHARRQSAPCGGQEAQRGSAALWEGRPCRPFEATAARRLRLTDRQTLHRVSQVPGRLH